MGMIVWLLATVVVTVCGVVYVLFVTHRIGTANALLGKDAIVADTSGWKAWIGAKLIGWKTIVLAWLAGLVQAISAFLASDLSPWQNMPWEKVLDEKVANWITFAIAMLIPLTHAAGMKVAAQQTPVDGA